MFLICMSSEQPVLVLFRLVTQREVLFTVVKAVSTLAQLRLAGKKMRYNIIYL